MHDHAALCPTCTRPFLVVEDVLAVLPAGGYLMQVGCTNCGLHVISTFSEPDVAALDAALERARREIEEAVARLAAGPLWTDVLAEA